MLTGFQVVSLVSILAATVAGGWYPLMRRNTASHRVAFPLGEAFTAGVFIALARYLIGEAHRLG